MTDDKRREEERVTINKEFESFDAFIHEYVTNISRSGVFIRSKDPLPHFRPPEKRSVRQNRGSHVPSVFDISYGLVDLSVKRGFPGT